MSTVPAPGAALTRGPVAPRKTVSSLAGGREYVGKNLTSFQHLVGCSVLLAGSGVSPRLVAFDWHLEGWAGQLKQGAMLMELSRMSLSDRYPDQNWVLGISGN